MSAAISGALIPHIAALIRGLVLQVPHIAEPVITVRAQLRSSLGARSRDPLAHAGYLLPLTHRHLFASGPVLALVEPHRAERKRQPPEIVGKAYHQNDPA